MVTAVRVRQPVSREKHAQIRVGHARSSRPIRNERRARLCPPKLGQRQTVDVLADSAASTPPEMGGKARVEFSVHTTCSAALSRGLPCRPLANASALLKLQFATLKTFTDQRAKNVLPRTLCYS